MAKKDKKSKKGKKLAKKLITNEERSEERG
jgi:hypothetical protein